MYTKHTDTILLFVVVAVCDCGDFILRFFLTYRDMRKVMLL